MWMKNFLGQHTTPEPAECPENHICMPTTDMKENINLYPRPLKWMRKGQRTSGILYTLGKKAKKNAVNYKLENWVDHCQNCDYKYE